MNPCGKLLLQYFMKYFIIMLVVDLLSNVSGPERTISLITW